MFYKLPLLANAVAEAYKTFRWDERFQLSGRGIKALEDRFEEQQVKIRHAQNKMDDLRTTLGISDPFGSEVTPPMIMTAETVRRLESLRIEKESQFMTEDTLIGGLKSLSRTELRQAIPSAVPDPQLNSLMEQLSLAEQ